MEIRPLSPDDPTGALDAADIFDQPLDPESLSKFLASPGHHLLVAWEGDEAIGFASGIEMTHPDKGTEMFLYELGVAETQRSRGIGRALVEALAEVAQVAGCYGMWVLTDPDNHAAVRAYGKAGGEVEGGLQLMLSWRF